MKNLEIYIHIPFCVRNVNIVYFLSFPADDDAKLRYVKGIMAEMIFYGPAYEELSGVICLYRRRYTKLYR